MAHCITLAFAGACTRDRFGSLTQLSFPFLSIVVLDYNKNDIVKQVVQGTQIKHCVHGNHHRVRYGPAGAGSTPPLKQRIFVCAVCSC